MAYAIFDTPAIHGLPGIKEQDHDLRLPYWWEALRKVRIQHLPVSRILVTKWGFSAVPKTRDETNSLFARSVLGRMAHGGVPDLQGKRQLPAVRRIRFGLVEKCPLCGGKKVCVTCKGSGKKS